MIIFICIYLLIGLVIQLLGQFWAAKDINTLYKGAMLDSIALNGNLDCNEVKETVDNVLNKKGWIIVNTLFWPINIIIAVICTIRIHIIFK